MIRVPIPKKFKLGGIAYKVLSGRTTDTMLEDNNWKGCHESSCNTANLILHTKLDAAQLSNTFLHEVLHSIDNVYFSHKLGEERVAGISSALADIFDQIGVRFVRKVPRKEAKTAKVTPS